jgi:predicted transcriptional regulator
LKKPEKAVVCKIHIGLRIELKTFAAMEKLREKLRRDRTNFIEVAIEQFIKKGGKIE